MYIFQRLNVFKLLTISEFSVIMFKRNSLLATVAAVTLSALTCDFSGNGRVTTNSDITADRVEQALDDLYTDRARCYVVREFLDSAAFNNWVQLTGGPSFIPLGKDLPITDERVIETIEYYMDNDNYLIAGEIASNAGYAKRDEAFIDLAIKTYLEGARNPDVDYTVRDNCYQRASELTNRFGNSLWERTEVAEEAIRFYIEYGSVTTGYEIMADLFPAFQERSKREEQRREELFQIIEGSEYQPFKGTWSSPRESTSYKRPENDNPCDHLEFRAFIHDGLDFEFWLKKIEEDPDVTCPPEQILRSYEAIGWFDHAEEFASNNGFPERVGLYAFISDELWVTNPLSPNLK